MNAIHLITSSHFIKHRNTFYSQTIIDKFIECCLKLDASIFKPYMHDDDVFEEKEKYAFLAQLYGMLDEFARDTLDDFTVTLKDTICNGCVKGYPVKHFKVRNNESQKSIGEFAFLIEIEKDILKDIYRCYDYKGCRTCTIGGGTTGLPVIEVSYESLMKSYRERPT
ncbi:MAG: hypothetical protein WKF91_03425 [Segetibacter sp.]